MELNKMRKNRTKFPATIYNNNVTLYIKKNYKYLTQKNKEGFD